jgi:hypothetical protein
MEAAAITRHIQGAAMQQTTQYFLRTIIGTAVCALAMHAGWAQGLAPDNIAQTGDLARWYQEDTTPRTRLQTLKKEAGAAYQEALADCKKAERAARVACMREARTMFEQDLADARQQTQAPRR